MLRKQTGRERALPIMIEQVHTQSNDRRGILAQPAHPAPFPSSIDHQSNGSFHNAATDLDPFL